MCDTLKEIHDQNVTNWQNHFNKCNFKLNCLQCRDLYEKMEHSYTEWILLSQPKVLTPQEIMHFGDQT